MQHTETSNEAAESEPTDGADMVDAALAEVRADLDRRRSSGELPRLPAGELTRQFDGVVEAVDAGITGVQPIHTGDLTGPAVLESWRPLQGQGTKGRIIALLLSPITRVVGVLVRRQVGAFSTRTAAVVEQLADRQNRMAAFLSRSFLDRQRRLEYRVAELEREVELLRSGKDTAAESDREDS